MVLIAEQSGGGGGGGLLTFLPIILLIVLMYFFMIRPQSKRRREAQEMQSRLAPGDEVQTVGGLFAHGPGRGRRGRHAGAVARVAMRFARARSRGVIAAHRNVVDDEETGTGTTRTSDEG